jgi:hypothetical protein
VYASESLVPAIHEIAVAAEFAITAKAAKKSDAHALTDCPALNRGAKNVDASDDFVSWNSRPFDRKERFDCGRI